MSKSTVLKHYEIPDGTVGDVKAKCQYCPQIISGNTKTTSNFRKHLQKKHRDAYLSLSQDVPTDKNADNQPSVSSFMKKKDKYAKDDSRQVQITDSILMFIAGDLLPLKTVESPHFRTLCEKLDPKYNMPSRKTVSSKLLLEKAASVQQKLKAELSSAQNVCLTLDLWSNRQMSAYLGITGHYLSDWILKSVMITCTRMKGRHTSDNIRHYYEETLACYGIADKIACIVTDNASNMKKTFVSLPGYEKDIEMENDSSDDENSEDIGDGDCCDGDDDETCSDKYDCLPLHLPCYAHTLQLVIKDGMKEAGPHLKGVIAKAASIVGHIRRSIHASEILENEKRVQAQNMTRWNSQIIMIRSILNITEEKLDELEFNVKLTAYERKLLKELCEILRPFEEATHLIQQQKKK